MPDLSSCFFCGAAVETTLEPYRLPDTDDVTVTLCPDCERKLDLVFEHVHAAERAGEEGANERHPTGEPTDAVEAKSGESPGEPLHEKSGGATESETARGGDDVAADVPPGDAVADDAGASSEDPTDGVPETDGTASADDDTAVDPEATDPDERAGVSIPTRSDVEREGSRSEPRDAGDVSSTEHADDRREEDEKATDDERPAGAVDADAVDPEPMPAAPADDDPAADSDGVAVDADHDAQSERTADAGDGASVGSPARAERESGDAADADAGTGLPSDVSVRTYNRVVRLLQNREFPVDRPEFETVATNAYELDRGECAAALDAMIEKDLLREHSGQLHKP